jgi:tetrahydromethanopterin:alpha-L-glutamate ligase
MGKGLRIGIITAYLEQDWHSQQLVAAVDRCAEAFIIRPEQLGAQVMPWGVSVMAEEMDLATIDGFILARGFGDRGNSDFLIPVYQILERSGKVLVNSINALLLAIDKFETSARLQQAGVATPKVVVVQDAALARSVVRDWGRAVAKPLFGSLGLGVELVDDTPQGYAQLPVLIERFGAIYLQEFVPTPGRDIRAFVVGPQVAASIYRVAMPGSWRTNIAQGGEPETCRLDAATTALAVSAAQAVGLDYTGVDILEGPDGPVVIEVNGNPLWQGVLQATGHNMANDIVAWVIERITQTAAKGGECLA